MGSLHSYPHIYALGHAAIAELLAGDDVIVEEKVDGSQFSFGVASSGALAARSRGAELDLVAPNKMFRVAVGTIVRLFDAGVLVPGWTYRCEYLEKPKHNTLAYGRVPRQNLILLDVNPGQETYLNYEEKCATAFTLGLEVVPLMWRGSGIGLNMDQIKLFLNQESILGGAKVEGVVVKNYHRFGRDKHVLMGKYVSEAFKEAHSANWKITNPGSGDIILQIAKKFQTEARWKKAVQHLAEQGILKNEPEDIGKLIGDVRGDLERECKEEIGKMLLDWGFEKISRSCTHGLPEWYKTELAKKQFAVPTVQEVRDGD